MRLLVVDDHPMFTEGLRFLLQGHYHALEMQQAHDSHSCISILDSGYTPDLILLDLQLPGLSGISLLHQLKQRDHTFPALVVSASQSLHDASKALKQGARGFISKASRSQELLHAINTVLQGDIYLPEAWSHLRSRTVDHGTFKVDKSGPETLTTRQLQVLELLAQGNTNKLIARNLDMAENTVKVHLRGIFRALQVSNRTACVQMAKQLGIIGR